MDTDLLKLIAQTQYVTNLLLGLIIILLIVVCSNTQKK